MHSPRRHPRCSALRGLGPWWAEPLVVRPPGWALPWCAHLAMHQNWHELMIEGEKRITPAVQFLNSGGLGPGWAGGRAAEGRRTVGIRRGRRQGPGSLCCKGGLAVQRGSQAGRHERGQVVGGAAAARRGAGRAGMAAAGRVWPAAGSGRVGAAHRSNWTKRLLNHGPASCIRVKGGQGTGSRPGHGSRSGSAVQCRAGPLPATPLLDVTQPPATGIPKSSRRRQGRSLPAAPVRRDVQRGRCVC